MQVNEHTYASYATMINLWPYTLFVMPLPSSFFNPLCVVVNVYASLKALGLGYGETLMT